MKNLFLLILAWCTCLPGMALTLGASTELVNLAAVAEVLEDPTGSLSFEQVSAPAMAGRFQPAAAQSDTLHFGFSASAHWIRIPLQRTADAPRNWVLEVPYAQIGELAFHAAGRPPVVTGSTLPLASRPLFHRFFVFPVELTGNPQYFYIRAASRYALTVPLQAWRPDAFFRHTQRVAFVQYAYYGGLLALLLYNLFLFMSLSDVRFLFYSLYALAFGLGMLAGNGYGRLFLWPDEAAFDENSQAILLSLGAVFAVAFTRSFLQTGRLAPRLDRCLLATGAVFVGIAGLLLAALWWPMPVQLANQTLLVSALAMCVLVVLASVHALHAGDKGARYFLVAWGVLWLGAAVASARQFGWLPSNAFTLYALQIASAAEMLLLSLALADMVHAERQRREQATGEMLAVLRTSETRLERAVQERTEQLQAALANEKNMLTQYVRFGSLISHEFRNPLGIIKAQLTLARKEQQLGVLQLDKRLDLVASATQRLQALFDKWLQSDRLDGSMQSIAARALPLPEQLQRWADAHQYLWAQHHLRWALDPAADTAWADPQLLEIAVLNLLENACKYSAPGTEVCMQTCRGQGRVGIAVQDQGPGIAAEHHGRLFEAFYRVAPAGGVTGMGLGLSIVQRIAQAHGGSLELDSTPGKGSRFCLWLPDAPPETSA